MKKKKTIKKIASSAKPSAMKAQESPAQAGTAVRYATSEEFERADRKVRTLHDGLFRRLAEYDRQR